MLKAFTLSAKAVTRGRKPGAKAAEPTKAFVGRKPVEVTEFFVPYKRDTAEETIRAACSDPKNIPAVVMELLRQGYTSLNEIPKIIGAKMLTDSDKSNWTKFVAALRDNHKQKLANSWVAERIGKIKVPRYDAFDVLETDADGNPRLYDVTEQVVVHLSRWLFGNIQKPLEFNTIAGKMAVPHGWEFDPDVQEIRQQQQDAKDDDDMTDDELSVFNIAAERAVAKIAAEWKSQAEAFKAEYGKVFRTRTTGNAFGTAENRLDYAADMLAGMILGGIDETDETDETDEE